MQKTTYPEDILFFWEKTPKPFEIKFIYSKQI